MKINCGLTYAERQALVIAGKHPDQQWRKFFAVWPRRVGTKDCRMFEVIERRKVFTFPYYDISDDYTYWEYRAIGD